MLTIDFEGDDEELQATEMDENASNEVSNVEEFNPSIESNIYEHGDHSAEDEEPLHHDSVANELFSEHQINQSVESNKSAIPSTDIIKNPFENSEEFRIEDDNMEYEGIKDEGSPFDFHQESPQFENNYPPPEEIHQHDPEIGHTETQKEEQNAVNTNDDLDSSRNQLYQPNPFDHWSQDPESGDGFFGSRSPTNENSRPDPESQGYSLLQDNDDPEMGSTGVIIYSAQERHTEDNFNLLSTEQDNQSTTDKVTAFSQVQVSSSQSITSLEFVAHQLIDPSDPVPQDMNPEKAVDDNNGESNTLDDKWWGVTENEEFNFATAQNESNAFNSSNNQHVQSQSMEEEDPFAQISQSNGPQIPNLFTSTGISFP